MERDLVLDFVLFDEEQIDALLTHMDGEKSRDGLLICVNHKHLKYRNDVYKSHKIAKNKYYICTMCHLKSARFLMNSRSSSLMHCPICRDCSGKSPIN